MNFAELMEFHPATAVRLLGMAYLIVVILFAVIFQKIFGKISGKLLLCFFAFSRLTDALSTVLCFKKLSYDYSLKANFLLRWFLTNNYFLNITVILWYNLLIFLIIYLFYKRCYNHSSVTKFTIKIGLLTFSLLGTFCTISNFFNL